MSHTAARKKDYIERVLRDIARRGRVLTFGAGLFFVLAGGILAVTAAALLDRWLILDTAVRLGVRDSVLSLVGGGLAVAAGLALRRTAAVGVARQVEAAYPGFKDALVTYVQMRRGHPLTAAQRQVLKVVGKRAGVLLTQVDPDEVLPARLFVTSGIVLGAALGLFLVLCVGFWTPFVTSVRRVLVPRAQVPPATATRLASLVVEPRNGPPVTLLPAAAAHATALRDSSCRIAATLEGELPARAVLYWRSLGGDAPWRSQARAQTSEEGLWRWRLDTGRRDILFYIAAGDVRSDRYTIRLVEPPAVVAIRVRYVYPEYTGLAPTAREGGDLSALAGTRAVLTATTNKPVASHTDLPCPELLAGPALRRRCLRPVLRIGDDVVPLAVQRNTLTATLTLRSPTSYTIHFPGQDGFWNPAPPAHRIRPQADQPPAVAILSPPTGRRVPVDAPLPVRVRATDDVAVRRLELLCRRGSEPPHHITIPLPRAEHTVDRSHTLHLRQLGLEPGATLELVARAADGRPPTPNRTTSQPVRLTLVAPQPTPRRSASMPHAVPAPPKPPPPRAEKPRPAGTPQQVRRLAQRQERLADRLAELPKEPAETQRQALAAQQDAIARDLERLSSSAAADTGEARAGRDQGKKAEGTTTGQGPPHGRGQGQQGAPEQQAGPAAQKRSGAGQGERKGRSGTRQALGRGQERTAEKETGKAGRGAGQAPGPGQGQGTASGTQPGTGDSHGGGGAAGQMRRLAAGLHRLSAALRRQEPSPRAASEARLAAGELLALGRQLERGEFAHRRVRTDGAPPEARRPGRTRMVGRGAAPSPPPRALPTDVPLPEPDELRRLVEEGRLRLSPAYRRLVEQYIEAVSKE